MKKAVFVVSVAGVIGLVSFMFAAVLSGCGPKAKSEFAKGVLVELKNERAMELASLNGCMRGLVTGERLRGIVADSTAPLKRVMMCERIAGSLAGLSINLKDSEEQAEIRACVTAPLIVGIEPQNEGQEEELLKDCAQ